MAKYFFVFIYLLVNQACSVSQNKKQSYSFQCDVRSGTKFYRILIDKDGTGEVLKGNGTFYTDSLSIETSNSSGKFKIDSLGSFFENLEKMKSKYLILGRVNGLSRAEVYYNGIKIFDGDGSNEIFWKMIFPIRDKLPKSYNPFLVSERPFE